MMSRILYVTVFAAIFSTIICLSATDAGAHGRGGVSIGIGVGPAFGCGYRPYYPPPYYAYPYAPYYAYPAPYYAPGYYAAPAYYPAPGGVIVGP
jgi:hypothetical protein